MRDSWSTKPGLKLQFLLKGALVEFDGVVKLIDRVIMCRCIVPLTYGITKTIGMNSLDSDTAFAHIVSA